MAAAKDECEQLIPSSEQLSMETPSFMSVIFGLKSFPTIGALWDVVYPRRTDEWMIEECICRLIAIITNVVDLLFMVGWSC